MGYQTPANGFRTFVVVWATQSVSVLGSALTFFALTVWLTQTLYPAPEQKTELAFALSAVSLAIMLPGLISAPFAGAWADRHDRKWTMIACDVLSGCTSLLVASMMAMHTLELWSLVAIAVIQGVTNTFHYSAFDTSYAMLVPEPLLARANGMMQTMWSLSNILAPALAASIITLPALARQGLIGGGTGDFLASLEDGAPLAISIDAVTFLFAAATLLFLFIPSPRHARTGAAHPSVASDIKEGALYIWHRRPLLWLLGTFAMANLILTPVGIFESLLVKFNLAADYTARGLTFESALALMTSAGGLGGLAGGVLISAWGGLKRSRVMGILIPLAVSGATLIGLGMLPYVYAAAAMTLCMLAMMPFSNAHSQAIWQIQTPRELQGRVFAVRRVIAQCTAPLSAMVAGVLGGLFNPGMVVAVLGVLLLVFSVLQMFNPYLLQVEDKAALDAMALSQEMPETRAPV